MAKWHSGRLMWCGRQSVRRACLASGVRLGIFGVTADAVRPYIAQGYTLIVAGVDTLMLGAAAQKILQQLSE